MCQGLVSEEALVPLVEDPIRRGVPVEIDLVAHHSPLQLKLPLREGAMADQISEELHGSSQLPSRSDGIDDGLVLRRIGIYGAAHHLHPIADVIRTAVGRPLEEGMLDEVSQPRQPLGIIPTTGVDSKSTPHHSTPYREQGAAQTVLKRHRMVCSSHCPHFFRHKGTLFTTLPLRQEHLPGGEASLRGPARRRYIGGDVRSLLVSGAVPLVEVVGDPLHDDAEHRRGDEDRAQCYG